MIQPRRRLRRRSSDNHHEVTEFFPPSSTEPSAPPQDTQSQSDIVSTPQNAIATVANDDRGTLDLDPIRTELLNDFHHRDFSESEYWDESHNWSDDGEPVSDEYWHFLGRFE
jgi:hypothetical protein